MIIVGIILIVLGFTKISGVVSNLGSESIGGAGIGMALILIGFVLAAAGGIIIYFANMKKLVEYSTNMTTNQSEKMGEARGRGMAKRMKK